MSRSARLRGAIAIVSVFTVLIAGQSGVTANPVQNVSLSEPSGIAALGDTLIAAEAGTGSLHAFAPDGTRSTLLDGMIPGVFTRGLTGVAVDGGGNVYVAAAEDGVVLFVAPDGQQGVYARGLGVPGGIAFDSVGNLLVADQAGKRVLRVAPNRTLSVVADGFAEAPFDVALDADGRILVSTQRDGKVWRLASGNAIQLAQTPGTAEGLAVAADESIFVGDGANGKVLRLTGGNLTTAATDLSGPLRLAFAGNRIHVSTQGEGAGSIRDRVVGIGVGVGGLQTAVPDLGPTTLPDAPAHSVAHEAGGIAVDPAPYLDILPEATSTYSGLGAFEPTVGVSPKTGAIFYNPKPTAGVNTQHILRSDDQGKTWTDVSPKIPGTNQIVPPTDLDPYVWVDRDTGRVFTPQLYAGCSYLSFSDDDGETWVPNPVACGVPVNDHQTVASGPPSTLVTAGFPNVVYYCYNGLLYSGCGRSLDGGLTFHPAGLPYPPGGCAGLTGHVEVGRNGTVFLPKADCGAGPTVAISRDDGTTWTRVAVAPAALASGEHEAHVAVDGAGNVYYTWIGPGRLPYLAVSTDDGRSWGPAMMVGAPGVTEAWGPSISAGDEGRIAVYYSGSTGDCCYEKRRGGEHMWNAYATISIDAHETEPTFLTTTFNDPVDPLRRGTCGPGRCGGRPTSFGDFLEVFVDHTGRPWAAMVDTCINACATPGLSGANNAERGHVGQLVRGPALVGEGVLTPPAWYG